MTNKLILIFLSVILLFSVNFVFAQEITGCKIENSSGIEIVNKNKCDRSISIDRQVSQPGIYTRYLLSEDGSGAEIRTSPETVNVTDPQGSGSTGSESGSNCKVEEPKCTGDIVCIPNPLKASSVVEFIDMIASWLLWIAIPITTLMVIWAGMLYITAGANSERITGATHTLTWASIGFGIVLLAKGITLIIRNFFGSEQCEALSHAIKIVYNIIT